MKIPLTKHGWREMLAATMAFGVLTVAGVMTFWPAAVLPAAAWLFEVVPPPASLRSWPLGCANLSKS